MTENHTAALHMMLADVLENIMIYTDNSELFCRHITEQIRELLQVKAVVLVQCGQLQISSNTTEKFVLLDANPVSYRELADKPGFEEMMKDCHRVEETTWVTVSSERYCGVLTQMGFKNLMIDPLIFNEIRVGALLLFDLYDESNSSDVLFTVQHLSGVISTTLFNALHLGNLEKLVEQRTARLLASEQRFKALAEHATDTIWTSDKQGRVLYVNPAVNPLLGYSPEEFIKTNIMHHIPHEELNLWADLLHRSKDDPGSNTFLIETSMMHKNGTRIPVEISSNAVFDDTGTFEYYLAITRDISERVRVSRQNERTRKMMEAVVSFTQDGIIVVQDGFIVFTNEAASQLLEYEVDALEGVDFHDVIAVRDREMVFQHYLDRLAGADIPHIYNVLMLSNSGEEIISEINASIMEYNGNPADLIFLRDIRQRMKNMQEVITAETQFRVFMNAIPGAAFIKDEQRRLIFINDYMKHTLGAEEWLNKDMSTIFDPELAGIIEENDRIAREKGYAIQNEKIPTSDGRVISFEVYKFSYTLPNGRTRLGGIAIDATDRLVAEAAILKNEVRLKRAMELADLGSLIFYHDSGALEWSENLPKMLGYDYEVTLSPELLLKHLHPEDTGKVLTLAASVEAGKIQTLDFRYLRGDAVRHCRAVVELVESGRGETSWINGIVQDITDETENAAKLKDYNDTLERDVQERTQTLQKSQDALTYLLEDVNEIRIDLENMNEKLLVETTERKRNEQLVTLQSDTLKKLTMGLEQREIFQYMCNEVHRLFPRFGCGILLPKGDTLELYTQAGMHPCETEDECRFSLQDAHGGCAEALSFSEAIFVTDLASHADASAFCQYIKNQGFEAIWCDPLLSKKSRARGIFVLACKESREPTPYEEILLNNGSKLSTLILERKEAEEQERIFTLRLQEVNKDLESFAYSVSHDLRAPLRHIDGYATALKNNILENLSSTDQHYLARITDSAKRMGTLIDDLLVFSRMGRRELKKRAVDFDQLVNGCLIELEPEYHDRKVEWDLQPLGTVYADPNLLKQVMINLLSNALKFTQTRPVAQIMVGKKEDDNGSIVYYVKDNGVGFDMKYSNKLFGVFQRLHRDDEFKGTGIGLANVKRIITRHGGSISATAAIDEGACFTFAIPEQ